MAPQRSSRPPASSYAAAVVNGPTRSRSSQPQPHPLGFRSESQRPDNALATAAASRSPASSAVPLPGRSRPATVDLEPDGDGWVVVRNHRHRRRYEDAPTVKRPDASKPRIPRWLVGLCFSNNNPRPSRGAKPREADDTKTSLGGPASLGWLPRSGDINVRCTT